LKENNVTKEDGSFYEHGEVFANILVFALSDAELKTKFYKMIFYRIFLKCQKEK